MTSTTSCASCSITEGIKWNAPSFCAGEYFAPVNTRDQNVVQIILHLGARVRHDIVDRVKVKDPNGLAQWLGKDRASVKFRDRSEIETNGPAFQPIVREWIAHLK